MRRTGSAEDRLPAVLIPFCPHWKVQPQGLKPATMEVTPKMYPSVLGARSAGNNGVESVVRVSVWFPIY